VKSYGVVLARKKPHSLHQIDAEQLLFERPGKNPLIAFKKLLAAWGCAERRSRPSLIA
jgi:hypothetical protein